MVCIFNGISYDGVHHPRAGNVRKQGKIIQVVVT